MLSKASPYSLAVFYMIAVKKDIGLKRYAMHREGGVARSLVHS